MAAKIAVVIPCRNEVNFISEAVDAIYSCDLPKGSEIAVFIVDGMSNDGTIAKISELQTKYPSLRLVENTKQLTPYAFNLGILAGKGADYFQIIGARHMISKNYLLESIRSLENNASIWCVGGAVDNVYLNKEGEIIAAASSTSFGMGLGNFRVETKSSFVDTVGTPMYPAWVFDKIGLFDEELVRNQDDEFNFRVTRAGGKILFNADISLKYYVRGSYKQLWRQFMQYGYWKVYVNKKHKTVTTIRQMVPPAFVAYLIVLAITAIIFPCAGLFGSIGLVLYLLLGLFVAMKKGRSLGPGLRIFTVFPVLHISYGWGYLKGIVKFVVLNRKPGERYKLMSR